MDQYRKVIEATEGLPNLNLDDLSRYKDFLYFVTLRDIRVRYKQTVLGIIWIAVQPLIQMVIFSFFFGTVANLDSEGIPYALYTFAALVPWTFFSSTLNRSTQSVVGSSGMIKKIYFPRLLLPISGLLSSLVDFIIPFLILIAMMLWFQVSFTWTLLWLPVFMALSASVALGAGVWLSALNVQFRDVRMAVAYIVQIWFWISPVAYADTIVSPEWELIYALNPMAGVLSGFRWMLLGTPPPEPFSLFLSFAVSTVLLISGVYYFRYMERTFADVV